MTAEDNAGGPHDDGPECMICGETVDGMTLCQFTDGSERWLCPDCEDEIVEEYGVGPVE